MRERLKDWLDSVPGDGHWTWRVWLIHLGSAAIVMGLGALYIIFVMPPSP